jgi:hypothetical protein
LPGNSRLDCIVDKTYTGIGLAMNKSQQLTLNSQQSVADKLTVMAEASRERRGEEERGIRGEREKIERFFHVR